MGLQAVVMGLRALVTRRHVESEMEREMRLHLELETEENIRRGMSPVEARRAAMVAFGGVEKNKEAVRDERSTMWIEQAAIDLRFALRGMRKHPGFTAAVIALLALGTGANAAIFSVVNQMILRPIPFAGGDRMVQLRVTVGGGQFTLTPPPPLVAHWRSRARAVEDVIVSQDLAATLGDTSRAPVKRLEGAEIVPGTMRFVSMRPVLGRDVLPADTLAGAPPIAILGHGLWKTDFGGSRDVLGKVILLNGKSHVVVGVAQAGFAVPYSYGDDVFTALQSWTTARQIDAIARLRPGFTTADAAREMAGVAGGLDLSGQTTVVDGSSLVSPQRKQLVLMLFGAVGFLLLIACANVANLLLSRAWSRQREFAVRAAMGAARGRIMRQVFTESLILALAGGAAGLLVAVAFLKLVIAVQPETIIGSSVRLDTVVLAWALGISALTGVLFGIAPALLIGDGRLGDALKSSARSATGSAATRRLRSGLVIVEVALSVILLVGAGLLVRTMTAMERADLGMDPRGLSSIQLRLPARTFPDSTVRRDVLHAVLGRVRGTPGIDAATYALTLPPDFAAGLGGIEIAGRTILAEDSLQTVEFNLGTTDFFRIAGMRFREGRPYAADPTLGNIEGGGEIVINERFARRFWPAGDAIGARVKRNKTWATVVGIVDNVDIPGSRVRGAGAQLYQSLSASPLRVVLMVRSRLPAATLEPLLRNTIRETASRVTTSNFSSADLEVSSRQVTHRFTLVLLGGFAILAVVLAGIGLHAVIAYSVSQRTREIGIRMALGAQGRQVAGLVFGQGMMLALIGVAAGCAAGAMATRMMRSLLYGVQPGDPLTMALVAAGLLVVALAASAVPARRAMRVDPVEMVRAE